MTLCVTQLLLCYSFTMLDHALQSVLNETTHKIPFVNTFLRDKYLVLIVVVVLVG
jgi:hypothetical protein